MALQRGRYANRDASARAIFSSDLDTSTKLMLASANCLLRTEQHDIDKATEIVGEVGRVAGRGLKRLWNKFKDSAQEWAEECERVRVLELEQAKECPEAVSQKELGWRKMKRGKVVF